MPQLTIETHRIGPLGFYAEVRDAQTPEPVFHTRIYEESDVVLRLAQEWVSENEWPPAA